MLIVIENFAFASNYYCFKAIIMKKLHSTMCLLSFHLRDYSRHLELSQIYWLMHPPKCPVPQPCNDTWMITIRKGGNGTLCIRSSEWGTGTAAGAISHCLTTTCRHNQRIKQAEVMLIYHEYERHTLTLWKWYRVDQLLRLLSETDDDGITYTFNVTTPALPSSPLLVLLARHYNE